MWNPESERKLGLSGFIDMSICLRCFGLFILYIIDYKLRNMGAMYESWAACSQRLLLNDKI